MRGLKPALATALVVSAIVPATTVTPAASGATAATKCLSIGVYQDRPSRTLAKFQKKVGPGVSTLSTYLTAGRLLDPRLIQLANKRKVRLMVSWLPDGGKDGPKQPKYRLRDITKGEYNASLKALARQLKQVKKGVIFRPMPEPNTPWYAWSGTVNRNTPATYTKAWKHVYRIMRKAGAKKRKVQFLWSPYARSIPNTGENAINAYFPGKKFVNLTGAVAYNFGSTAGLSWATPAGLFQQAYNTIQALAPRPFWLAETASTGRGGNKAEWINSLKTLRTTSMPKLRGVVWLDAKDRNGDFRLSGKPVKKAFKSLLRKSCR